MSARALFWRSNGLGIDYRGHIGSAGRRGRPEGNILR